MVNSSKVLTVSYGTFSCTLEGFDDSFDTMKAIAEYFRDLAADDRYFGAEPPTPDADMLARIAEREVSRRVEAHRDGDKFVLRTTAPLAQIETESDVDAATLATEAEAQAKAAAELEQTRLAEAAAQEARAEEERVAKEAQERTQARAARRARLAEAAQKADAERLVQAEAERVEAERDAAAERQALAQRQAEAQAQAEAERKEKAAKEAAMLAEQSKHDQEEPDSVAAKLARIRAVVGQPVSTPATPTYSEDEHADDIMQGQPGDTDLEDILDLDETSDEEIEEEVIVAATPKVDANDAISNVMSKLNANVPSADLPDFDADLDDALDAEPYENERADAPSALLSDVSEVETPKAPIRARVIKMKREEFEAAIASGDIEEELDDAQDTLESEQAQTDAPVQDSSLSRDDEDELARELAAVEAELATHAEPVAQDVLPEPHDTAELAAEIETPSAQTSNVNARGADDLVAEPDIEMDRLMNQASSELDEPDGKKRRNALGHLRAAVASARADKHAGPQVKNVDETQTYRDDLQSAVQPRRPVRRLTAGENASSAARPPLKLVEEQRVDTPQAAPVAMPEAAQSAPVQPVRPRRIRAGETPTPSAQDISSEVAPDGGTFNEFAEELGATELPDLLEAAAAYLAYVEGRDQFSRPQLMTKVRMVQEENFSREDGLRSFGQLLRQGKIEKIAGGRFTVSDRISFKPDTRAVG
ncbi:hypothetical protein LY10_02189 [Planktotalea frisia]|uniref:Lipoprotein n=1 Tax=Planktotalea frisia TaxID=696762 RepID=A0A1L9NWF3_9RHOB|nr:hypothetical protein [Planktotalea frisia]OJI93606.1 hypothetical protein PFRI_21600 [Planktotalea frisia]PZX28762.1 hypothetical protein LY10_02189 [Planktotalea frisia]